MASADYLDETDWQTYSFRPTRTAIASAGKFRGQRRNVRCALPTRRRDRSHDAACDQPAESIPALNG